MTVETESGVHNLVVFIVKRWVFSWADVAELVDATDLGSVARKGVEVQVLSSAWPGAGPAWARGLVGRRLLCTEEIVGSNPTGSTSQINRCRFSRA